ncbi:MAG TPA: aldehyde dehydrogenase family protein, partial [Polyangiaceae bacterium]|nr:aldehyde dehydrogenase family protein [Polyangiaceae bacterium]
GGPAAGKLLFEQALNGLFFTGSVATGRAVARAAAERLIPVGLELGGKDPAYAAPDVDVVKAAAALADGAFYNTGQSCCAVERIYVHQAIYGDFVEAFVAEVHKLKLGDPLDDTTTLGPLARGEAQLVHLEQQVSDARAKGARVLTGGKRADRPGFFFEPTVLVDVDHSMQVMRDETFGPVIGLMSVASDDAALDLMNDTDYGLTAAVYTNDAARAQRLLTELDVGSAYWNCCDRVSPALPWSGRRNSGLGTTLSTYGIEAFTQPKAWHKRLA